MPSEFTCAKPIPIPASAYGTLRMVSLRLTSIYCRAFPDRRRLSPGGVTVAALLWALPAPPYVALVVPVPLLQAVNRFPNQGPSFLLKGKQGQTTLLVTLPQAFEDSRAAVIR